MIVMTWMTRVGPREANLEEWMVANGSITAVAGVINGSWPTTAHCFFFIVVDSNKDESTGLSMSSGQWKCCNHFLTQFLLLIVARISVSTADSLASHFGFGGLSLLLLFWFDFGSKRIDEYFAPQLTSTGKLESYCTVREVERLRSDWQTDWQWWRWRHQRECNKDKAKWFNLGPNLKLRGHFLIN